MTDQQASGILPLLETTLPDIEDADRPLMLSWLPSGMALIVADRPNIIDKVRELGLNMFYLVADKQWLRKWEGRNVPGHGWVAGGEENMYKPTLFKCVFNAVGYSIHEAPEERAGLEAQREEAAFALPKIPYDIIQRLDAFFREVARTHGTEAIVVLTFDPTIDGPKSSKGWGVAVPKQRNTAGHCNYDQESIVQDLPDNAIIVGTAHSHPKMPAFASGTDHNDQADFDGIHITLGWQENVQQNATQYHIEIQMGGKSWTLKPEAVFTEAPKPPTFPEIATWTAQVSKAGGGNTYSGTTSTHTPAHGTPTTRHTPAGATNPYDRNQGFGRVPPGFLLAHNRWADAHEAPAGAPSPKEFMVIAELLDDNEANCPMCQATLDTMQILNRRCTSCFNWLSLKGETLDEIAEQRIGRHLDFFDIDPNRQTEKPIRFWKRWTDEQGNLVERIDEVLPATKELLPFDQAPTTEPPTGA